MADDSDPDSDHGRAGRDSSCVVGGPPSFRSRVDSDEYRFFPAKRGGNQRRAQTSQSQERGRTVRFFAYGYQFRTRQVSRRGDQRAVTFVDTSAIYAILDRSDANHETAKTCWFALLDCNDQLFTTNYVVVESCALAQSRLGLEAVRSISEELLPVMEIVWVDEPTHSIAMAALLAAQRRKLSLVDCVSFAVSRLRGAQAAFAFDQHFLEEGFRFPAG